MSDRQTLAGARPLLMEEAAATATRLAESRPLAEAQPSISATGHLSVQLIDPGWGSSGYYSPGVLAEAATSRVFPAGTQMYLDHPSATEAHDRPERSVRDLAAVLTTDAAVDTATGALVAEAQVFTAYASLLTEMRDVIGLSIRARGMAETGEAEGRTGPIITSLDEGLSVDFVTAAGRGGRILEVLESARRRTVGEATANDVRDALSAAVSDAHGGDGIYTWVRDYDPDKGLVYFDVDGDADPRGTFQQSYAIGDDSTATLSGQREEVTPRTTYVPVNPAGSTTTQESTEDSMAQIQIDEAEHGRLVAEAGRVQALEADRVAAEQRATAAEAQLAEGRRRDAARPVIAEAFTGTTAPAATVARVTESLLAALPAQDNGDLDTDALRTSVSTARTAAEAEIAEALSAAGVGRVTGFGHTASGDQTVTRESSDKARARAFGRPIQEG